MRKILVMGLGGAGMNISHHIQEQINCPVLAVNTDSNALKQSGFERQLLIGPAVCKGDSANVPARGRRAAEESRSSLEEALFGVDTLVLVAGLGAGTGTGAAAVIVDLAQSMGLRVIVAVVLPFEFEADRREVAFSALPELQSKIATLLVYDNANAIKEKDSTGRSLLEVFESSARKIAADISAKIDAAADES